MNWLMWSFCELSCCPWRGWPRRLRPLGHRAREGAPTTQRIGRLRHALERPADRHRGGGGHAATEARPAVADCACLRLLRWCPMRRTAAQPQWWRVSTPVGALALAGDEEALYFLRLPSPGPGLRGQLSKGPRRRGQMGQELASRARWRGRKNSCLLTSRVT